MKIKNLVYLNNWFVETNSNKLNYSFLDNSLKLKENNNKIIGLKVNPENEINSWLVLRFSFIEWSSKVIEFDISKCKKFSITYKAADNYECHLVITIKRNGINELFFVKLDSSDKWITKDIYISEFNNYNFDNKNKIDLSKIYSITFSFKHNDKSGENNGIFLLKDLIIDKYFVNFNYIDNNIYFDSLINRIYIDLFKKYNTKKLLLLLLNTDELFYNFQVSYIDEMINMLYESKNRKLINKHLNLKKYVSFEIVAYEKAKRLLENSDWLSAESKNILTGIMNRFSDYNKNLKYRFTNSWFDLNLKYWPKFLSIFKDKKNLSFLEIGSYEGKSTIWLLENILTDETSIITCIDIFVPYYSNAFDENIRISGKEKQVIKLTGKSNVILRKLDKKYDLIYVDGDHTKYAVIKDIILSWRLLTVKGIMILDDYLLDKQMKTAIDMFLKLFKEKIKILHKYYQVIIEKTAE